MERLLAKTAEPNFWSTADAHVTSRELARLQDKKTQFESLASEVEELDFLASLIAETPDPELEAEFYTRSTALRQNAKREQLQLLMNDEYDESNALVSVHPGAGGLDSQDWAEILYRMYLRWGEAQGFSLKILELLQDMEAGIKSVTLLVKGRYAYGYLKAERGVHRLVRISPFDAAKRRHTSFASVDVSPELPEDVEIDIRMEDLKLDTFRASGAGGQYVNMTDSAVRITHLPTGIVVSCQDERSQHMNRAVAMQILKSRLFEMQLRERQEKLEALQGEKKDIEWGSQIRSYVLHPYTLVKDHRTNYETGNVQAVLDGDIQDFIMAYLRWKKTR
jgi:peptide chain release factor 2